jgi:hypothetical protein
VAPAALIFTDPAGRGVALAGSDVGVTITVWFTKRVVSTVVGVALPQAVRSNPAPDKSVKARTIFLLILFLLGKFIFRF